MNGGFIAGAIVGKLLLDKSQWAASVSDVKKDEDTLSSKAANVSAGFTKMGKAATIAGGAILGTMGLMISQYIKTGDEIDKMSKRTGMATEALSELAYMADISGANLGDVERSTKRMAGSLLDAKAGLETSTRMFDVMGLKVDDLMKMNPEQQFFAIGEAIATIPDPTIRAALAQDVFGKSGTSLLPMFKEGPEGMRRLREEARQLGIIYDQEAAEKAAKLKDAQTALKASFQGLSMSIVENVVPVITGFVKKVTEIIVKVKDWSKEHPGLVKNIAMVAITVGGLLTVLGPVLIILPKLAAGFGLLMNPMTLVAALVAGSVILWMKLKAAKDEVRRSEEQLIETGKSLRQKLIDMKNEAGLTGEEFGALTNKYKGNIVAMTMAIHHGKEGVKLQGALATVSAKHKEEIDKQRAAYEAIIPKFGDYGMNLDALMEKQETWVDFLAGKGILTIKEKTDRLAVLKGYLGEVGKAYAAGKLDIAGYTDATMVLTQEIKSLSSYMILLPTILPKARDMSGVVEAASMGVGALNEFQIATTENIYKMKVELDTLDQAWNRSVEDITAALTTWGESTGNIFTNVAGMLSGFINSMITQLGRLIIAEQMASMKTWALEKVRAIAKGVSSVFSKIPFPLNIAAAAAIVGIITGLFSKFIPKFEKGGPVLETGLAVVHKGEYITPLAARYAGGAAPPGMINIIVQNQIEFGQQVFYTESKRAIQLAFNKGEILVPIKTVIG